MAMVEVIIDTSVPIQVVALEIERPHSDVPHQIGVTVTYPPNNKPAKGVLVRLTHSETGDSIDEITNAEGKGLFELLNLQPYGYLNGDEITVEVVE